MATNKQLKFFKGASAPAAPVAGMIWFCTSDRTIRVYTGTDWEKYAGLVDATWNGTDKLLTITSANGNTTTLNLSDMASASGVAAQIQTINTNISNAQAAADAAQADVDAVEEKLGDGFSKDSTVTAQLASVKATADAAAVKVTVDAELAKKADADKVAQDIAAAKSSAEAIAAADATSKANQAKADAINEATRLDGITNSRIDTLDAAYKDADEAILDQIEGIIEASVSVKNAEGDKYVVVTKAEDKNEYTISSKGIDDAIKVESDRAAVAEAGLQGAIDEEKGRINTLIGDVEGDDALSARQIVQDEVAKQLTSENISDSFDTLKEMAEWISAHPADVQAMNNAISKNAADIADEIAARDAADKVHAAAIEALEEADAAQDELIAKKADQTALDETNGKVSALEGLVGTTSVHDQIDAKIDALKLDDTYVNESDYTNDQTAVSNRIKAVEDRATDLDGRMTTAEGDIDDLEAATGFVAGYVANDKSNYIKGATSLKSADDLLDAEILKVRNELGEVAASVTNKNVDASGDTYVNAVAANNKVTISTNVNTLAQAAEAAEAGNTVTGLATTQDVYNALCWVEFE